jgi:hypothetical protein
MNTASSVCNGSRYQMHLDNVTNNAVEQHRRLLPPTPSMSIKNVNIMEDDNDDYAEPDVTVICNTSEQTASTSTMYE